MSIRPDLDRRAAARACLIVLSVPLALGFGALAGRVAVDMDESAGAVALLLAAGVETALFLAAFDWALDRLAARLLAPLDREVREREQRGRVEPNTASIDRLSSKRYG